VKKHGFLKVQGNKVVDEPLDSISMIHWRLLEVPTIFLANFSGLHKFQGISPEFIPEIYGTNVPPCIGS
jgi:hypothetical protein